jgi:acyl-coenzyme A synthetase/AMP-(fatty) acid ligase
MPFPYRIHPIAAIPRTPQGKIKRPALHDAVFPRQSQAAAE